jgi:hypothetical protein
LPWGLRSEARSRQTAAAQKEVRNDLIVSAKICHSHASAHFCWQTH